MIRALTWLGIALVVVPLSIAALSFLARFGDGPFHMFPGGPLDEGMLVREPVTDWSFVADVETIEMQLIADRDRSRTTWILFHEDRAYLPVTLGVPPFKAWHHLAAAQGAAVVRIHGRRYPATLVKIDDPPLLQQLELANASKYPPAPGSDEGSWYFRLDARTP